MIKTVMLTIAALLCWQYGYSQKGCSVKKRSSVSITKLDVLSPDWEEDTDEQNFTNACLKVFAPVDMDIKLRHVRQLYNAYISSIDKETSLMIISPRVVNKKGMGVYDIYIRTDSLQLSACILFNGKKVIIPAVPNVKARWSGVPKEVYQARLKVVEAFLRKHDGFTNSQKERITRFFTNGTTYIPQSGRVL